MLGNKFNWVINEMSKDTAGGMEKATAHFSIGNNNYLIS